MAEEPRRFGDADDEVPVCLLHDEPLERVGTCRACGGTGEVAVDGGFYRVSCYECMGTGDSLDCPRCVEEYEEDNE